MKMKTLRYVPHSQVKRYLSKGYKVVSAFEQTPHHSKHAVIMEQKKSAQ